MRAIPLPGSLLALVVAAAALGVAVLPAAPAAAGDRPRSQEVRTLRESGRILSMEDILARARAIRPGQVVEVELEREDAKYVYELKIIDDADRVHKLEMDAASGELIERQEK